MLSARSLLVTEVSRILVQPVTTLLAFNDRMYRFYCKRLRGNIDAFQITIKNCKIAQNYPKRVCWKYMIYLTGFHNVYKNYN